MKLREKITGRLACIKLGHYYWKVGDSLIGDWIRCRRCNKLEEYVPGAHEPAGYNHHG